MDEEFMKGDIVVLKSGGPALTVLDTVPDDPEHHVVCGLSTLYFGYQVHSVRALALQLKQQMPEQLTFVPSDLVTLKSGGVAMVVLDLVPDDPEEHVICGLCTFFGGYQVHSIPRIALQPKPIWFERLAGLGESFSP